MHHGLEKNRERTTTPPSTATAVKNTSPVQFLTHKPVIPFQKNFLAFIRVHVQLKDMAKIIVVEDNDSIRAVSGGTNRISWGTLADRIPEQNTRIGPGAYHCKKDCRIS